MGFSTTLIGGVTEGLAKWHEDGSGVDETIEALTGVLALLAYHRENVKKAETPELGFGDDDE